MSITYCSVTERVTEPSTFWDWLNAYSGALALVLAAVAAVWALVQLYHSLTIRKHEFEDIYVQRYWRIMDELSVSQKQALHSPGRVRRMFKDEKVKSTLWKYLELCEDQADLRAANLITSKTWQQWHGGVQSAASRPPYLELLDQFMGELGDTPESEKPFSRLREARECEGFYDPRAPWFLRFTHGARSSLRVFIGLPPYAKTWNPR